MSRTAHAAAAPRSAQLGTEANAERLLGNRVLRLQLVVAPVAICPISSSFSGTMRPNSICLLPLPVPRSAVQLITAGRLQKRVFKATVAPGALTSCAIEAVATSISEGCHRGELRHSGDRARPCQSPIPDFGELSPVQLVRNERSHARRSDEARHRDTAGFQSGGQWCNHALRDREPIINDSVEPRHAPRIAYLLLLPNLTFLQRLHSEILACKKTRSKRGSYSGIELNASGSTTVSTTPPVVDIAAVDRSSRR